MNSEACGSWLPLTEYSTKYKISMSTLRRRIKADDIKFRFEEGKYFIMDEPVGTHQRVLYRPSQVSDLALVGAHHGVMKSLKNSSSSDSESVNNNRAQYAQGMGIMDVDNSDSRLSHFDEKIQISKITYGSVNGLNKEEPIIAAANQLLIELKKAYSKILQEKEEQILQLRGEVADLKTLVRLLESDNNRLKDVEN